MGTKIEKQSISGKIQNELWNRGIKCDAMELCWFTDRPIHAKSKNTQSMYKHKLDMPYMTNLGFKTAERFLNDLRNGLIIS